MINFKKILNLLRRKKLFFLWGREGWEKLFERETPHIRKQWSKHLGRGECSQNKGQGEGGACCVQGITAVGSWGKMSKGERVSERVSEGETQRLDQVLTCPC